MPVSLKQLRYFVALADAGSFGAAALEMSVTQPALSLQIKALERDLNVRLVDRLPRGVRLTTVGLEVVDRARRILGDVIDLEQAIRHREGLSGRLQLGVIPTVAPYLLPRVLTRLRSSDITLDIRIREAQTAQLLTELQAGSLDGVVMALPVEDDSLAVTPLFHDAFLLCGSRNKLSLAGDQDLRPPDVDAGQLLLLDEGHCLADQALEVCGLRHRGSVDLGASSLATLTGLVAQGFGMTFLPEIAVDAEARAQPELALRRFSDPAPGRDLALVTRSGAADGGWIQDLAVLLKEAGHALLDVAGARVGLDNEPRHV